MSEVLVDVPKYVRWTNNLNTNLLSINLPIIFKICFGYSKELSHCNGSFENPQHMFWLKIRKTFFNYVLLTEDLDGGCGGVGSENYDKVFA